MSRKVGPREIGEPERRLGSAQVGEEGAWRGAHRGDGDGFEPAAASGTLQISGGPPGITPGGLLATLGQDEQSGLFENTE